MIVKNLNTGRVTRTEDGLTQEVQWLVTDIDNTDDTESRQSNLLKLPQIPNHGQRHRTENIEVVNTQVEWLDGSHREALITVNYGKAPDAGGRGVFQAKQKADKDGPTVIRGSFRLRTEERFEDINGTLFRLDPPNSVNTDVQRTDDERQSQWLSVDVDVPTHIIQHERLENEHPAERARAVVGKRNARQEGPYKKHSLLCDGMDYMSDDGGLTYACTYFFSEDSVNLHRFSNLGWIDPRTGQLHPDNTTDVASGLTYPSLIKDIELLEDANFGSILDIDFGDKRRKSGLSIL